MSVELHVPYRTQRVGSGPVTIASSERRMVVPERHRVCEHCGQVNVIDRLASTPHPRIIWPVPKVSPGMEANNVLPPRPEPPTLEERVAELELQVAELRG
jgi:hypothetical protein